MASTSTAGATNVRWRLLALAMGASFVNQFNRISMPVAGDLRIMDGYQISPVDMGLIYSAFLLGYTLFMTPGGWLVDRLGPRRGVGGDGSGLGPVRGPDRGGGPGVRGGRGPLGGPSSQSGA